MPPPNAPSGLTATAQPNSVVNPASNPEGSGKITLAWTDNSTNETGFKIERAELLPDGTWTAFAQKHQTGQNTTTYNAIGLKNATTYKYRVRAYSSTLGNSSYSNEAEATTNPV